MDCLHVEGDGQRSDQRDFVPSEGPKATDLRRRGRPASMETRRQIALLPQAGWKTDGRGNEPGRENRLQTCEGTLRYQIGSKTRSRPICCNAGWSEVPAKGTRFGRNSCAYPHHCHRELEG